MPFLADRINEMPRSIYLQSSREMFATMLNDNNFKGYCSRSILNKSQINPN